MVELLPPVLSMTFIAAVVAPLVIGLLVGFIAKNALKIGVAVAVLIGILIVLGVIMPNQVLGPLTSLLTSSQAYAGKVRQLAGYLPYSSITFVIGLALGFLKG